MRTTRIIAALVAGTLAAGALLAAPLAANAAIEKPQPGVSGNFEAATVSKVTHVDVRGWASVQGQDYQRVAVYVDGRRAANVLTGSWRPDVGAYLGIDGNSNFYGWKASFTVKPGTHVVRAYVITPDGSNPLIGTKTVTVSHSPVFRVDSVTAICPNPKTGWQRVKIVGWEFDPDDLGSVGYADVYTTQKDGTVKAVRRSNLGVRPDVQKAYGLRTDWVGVDVVASAPNLKTVQVYAVNMVGEGTNPLMTTVDYASLPKTAC